MRSETLHPSVRLLLASMEAEGGPYDSVAKGVKRTYREMTTPAGLAEVATYATAIGPHKLQLIALKADGTLDEPSPLIHDAHAAGLKIHAYTFRAENQFLPNEFENNMNVYGVSNMCCTVDYKVAETVGEDKLTAFCRAAHAAGMSVEMWGNTALSTLTYLFAMRDHGHRAVRDNRRDNRTKLVVVAPKLFGANHRG